MVYIFPNSFKLFPLKYFQIHQFQISLLDQGVFDHINYKNVYQIIKLHILYNISLYTTMDWIAQFLLLYYLFILFVNCYIFVNCYKLLYFCLVYQSKTNVKLILPSASNRWGFWLVINYASIYNISDLNVFKNINNSCDMCNNSSNELFGTNVYKTLEVC